MGFSMSLMPEKSLQVTRLRLVTWKDFSGIRDLEKPILALPPHRIGSLLLVEFQTNSLKNFVICNVFKHQNRYVNSLKQKM